MNDFKPGCNLDSREAAFQYINSSIGWDYEHIMLNKSTLERYFNILLPGKVIQFINRPTFYIDTNTGIVVDNDLDISTKKMLQIGSMIMNIDDFNNNTIKSKYLYILSINSMYNEVTNKLDETTGEFKVHCKDGVYMIKFGEYNPNKKAVTFTIDEPTYSKFSEISEKMAINKSKFIENKIREFVDNNS